MECRLILRPVGLQASRLNGAGEFSWQVPRPRAWKAVISFLEGRLSATLDLPRSDEKDASYADGELRGGETGVLLVLLLLGAGGSGAM